jgi:hypothetical protein
MSDREGTQGESKKNDSGRSSLDEDKKQHKIDECSTKFFLAKIHNRIKSNNGALNQPIMRDCCKGVAISTTDMPLDSSDWLHHGCVLFWLVDCLGLLNLYVSTVGT